MKWGRKKSAPPSSSSPTNVINRVLPFSWFSMFKHKGCNFDSKNKQKNSFEFPTPSSYALREGRFYSIDEDDAFWRLSFREGRRSTGGINPLWCDSDHDFEFPVSDFKSSESTKMEASTRQECRKFNEMVSDIKKMKEKRGKERIIAESNGGKARICSRKEKIVDDHISRKLRGLKFDDGEEKMSNLVERDIFPVVTENMQHKNPIIDQMTVPNWQDYEGRKKLKEVKIKHESKKKSAYTSRGVKSYSPRTECKIRALEDMKKARTKTKMKERKEEKVLEGNTIFDSVAVAKSSFNPERDFRESMVEMIREKRIGHPQDLEELLACYLTLNCDEYHDLIIKVFRQVWIELTEVYIDPPLQNGVCFDY